MFIENIEVEQFGSLSNISMHDLGSGVQVLHGTNEIGKTSLLEFVRGVFFGFEALFRRGVLDPQVPCAGRLVVVVGSEGRRVSIERRHEGPHLASLTRASYEDDVIGLGGDTGDVVNITDLDSTSGQDGPIYLQDLVGDIDESAFTNVMAFGLDELHELRTLDPEGCGSRLYELAAGLDRSKVSRVLSHLRDATDRLDSSEPTVSPIESLEQRKVELLQRIKAMNAPALSAGNVAAEVDRIESKIHAQKEAIVRSEHFEDVIREALPLESLYQARGQAAERLASINTSSLVHPDRDVWKRMSRYRDRLIKEATTRKKIRAKRAKTLSALPEATHVWNKRATVTSLLDEEPRVERLVAEIARSESHARLAARRFGEQIGMAGLSRLVPIEPTGDMATDASTELLLPEGFALSFAPLRNRARQCSVASKELAIAKRAVTEAEDELDATRNLVSGAGSHLNGMTITEAIEEAGGQASAIRNRIAAGERLKDLDESLVSLEHEVNRHMEGQLLPLGWLIPLGGLFVVGAAMLLSGLLLPTSVTGSLAYAIAALGIAGTGVASVTTWSLDRAASTRLEAAKQQYEMVTKQREATVAQLSQLEGVLPGKSSEALDQRLTGVQEEVERLEGLAGREASIQVLSERLTVAQQSLQQAIKRRKSARHHWRRSLEHRGLPSTLTPRDIRLIELHRQSLLTLDDDRRRLSDEARHKREELADWSHRIDQVMVDCDLVPEGNPLDHIRQLKEQLEQDRQLVRARAKATRNLERARRRHRSMVKRVKSTQKKIEKLFLQWDTTSEEAFLQKVDQRPLHKRLRKEYEAAETDWINARQHITEPQDLDDWLSESETITFQTRLTDAMKTTEQLRDSLRSLEEQLAPLSEKLQSAKHDRSTEPLQAELAKIERELATQRDRRQLLERAGSLLEETRAVVARDHQPPTLRDASHWLMRLTNGRYTRITTAVDEARLEVHDASGSLWQPERLSRGTREQVFLALRLALIRDLQRHGVMLPVVMDDALVNFDDSRAESAARVLVEFVADQPQARQLLALTCHAHVASLFSNADATVRELNSVERKKKTTVRTRARETDSPTPVTKRKPTTSDAPTNDTDSTLWDAENYFFGDQANSDSEKRKKTKKTKRKKKNTEASPDA